MTSRERILNAAISVFAKKGRYGAHMEDIAALAHINKAMIYYIFRSKDELYLEVLKAVFTETATSLSRFENVELKTRSDYIQFFTNFIKGQISFFHINSLFTKIMIDAMSNGGEEIKLALQHYKANSNNEGTSSMFRAVIDKGIADGFIRNIDVDQFIISIVGMINVYFLSPIMAESLDIDIKDENRFLEERKESIIDLVLNSILVNETGKQQKSRYN